MRRRLAAAGAAPRVDVPDFTGLVIATPAYGGQVTSPYLLSMVETVIECGRENISHYVHVTSGDALVSRARAVLLGKFLQTGASHLLWIDADMSWSAEDVFRFIRHGVDFVVGAYRQKKPGGRWNVFLRPEDGDVAPYDRESGLLRIGGAGLGFAMITRMAIVRMIALHPERRFDHRLPDGGTLPCWDLFGPVGVQPGGDVFVGEDLRFCLYWTDLGGEIWLDPAVRLGHHGQAEFGGDVRESFEVHLEERTA